MSNDPYAFGENQPSGDQQPSAQPAADTGAGAAQGAPYADPYSGQQPPPYAGQQPPPYAGQQPPPQYQAQGPYGQQPGYAMAQAPGADQSASTNLQLNYWLSAFFGWPAIIFYLIDKDKNPLLDQHLKEVLNLGILRVIVGALVAIPGIGWLIGGIGSLALLVIGIMGALAGPDAYRSGQPYKYPFNIAFVK